MKEFRALLLAFAVVSIAQADDWPQWLGPKRDGATREKVAPWKGDLKKLWEHPVGAGYGVPVVAGGRCFIHDRVKDKEEERVVAYDAKTGAELWRDTYT